MNLAQHISYWNNVDLTDAFISFFDAMEMPVPQAGQFTRTTDKGELVFMDAPGCVLRITNDIWHPAIEHDRILQPLFSRKVDTFRAEIFAGIKCPATDQHILQAAMDLRDSNISFTHVQELREDNFGYLPEDGDVVPENFSVLIDLAAVERKSDCSQRAPVGAKIQRKLFGPLIDAFHAAWPEDSETPDKSKLRDVWHLCAKMKACGILNPDWQTPGRFYGDFKNAKSGGHNYAAAWSNPALI